MTNRNWSKSAAADRARRHGTAIAVEPEAKVYRPRGKAAPMTKEEMRRQADALLAKANVPVKRVPTGRTTDLFGHRPAPNKAASRPAFTRDVPPGLVIYCDGCCIPNPGVGGWGFVVYSDGTEVHSVSGGDLVATNQTMELTAALRALEWIVDRGFHPPVSLISDSMYVVNGCNDWRHGWKEKGWKRGGPNAKAENAAIANLDLWKALDVALTALPIKLEWCKGHAGIIGNERADELSNEGRDSVAFTASQRLVEEQLHRPIGGILF